MAFDIATAQPMQKRGFDLSSAKPEDFSNVPSSQLLPGQQQQPSPRVEQPGFFDAFTGASRETEESRRLPEVMSLTTPVSADKDPGFLPSGRDLKIAGGMLASLDEQDQKDVIQENDPQATFRKDEKGNTIVKFGNGQEALLNAPGFSTADALRTGAQMLSFIPAARASGMFKSLLAKIGVGGAAAGATQLGLQATEKVLGAEDPFRMGDVALAGALGGAAETVVPAFQGVRNLLNQSSIKKTGEEVAVVSQSIRDAEAAQKGLKKSSGVDVPLFQAQKTDIPAMLEQQSFVAQLPAGTMTASKSLRSQNKKVGEAVDSLLSKIAPDESIITGSEKFRTASQRAVQAAKNIRKEKTSPLFKEAFETGADVNLDPVKEIIDKSISKFPQSGEINKTLSKVLKLFDENPTLRQLQGAKLEIDQMLNKFGENSLGNTTKREVVKIKETLLNQMDEASPAFKNARKEFIKQSPGVNAVQDSLIGKISNLDDTQLKTISRKMFDPAETNPAVIRKAKKIIDNVDPDAWNELVRTELERRMGSISGEIGESTTENIPGKIQRAIFGNEKQKSVLMNGVDRETRLNLGYLNAVLNRAKKGRPGGSQTAAREEIKKELRGGVWNSIQKFIGSPTKSLGNVVTDVGFDKRTRVLAEALYDPKWKVKMKDLRKLGTNSPVAARAFAQLLNDISDAQEE